MATYIPVTNLPIQFEDSSGLPLSGGSLWFYLAGTTTATDLYSDSSGTSIGQSIELNSLGFPQSGGNTIFLFRDQSKAIKIVLCDDYGATEALSGAVLATMDNIPAVASFDSTSSAKLDTIEENADVTDATNVAAAGALMTTGGTMSGNISTDSDAARYESVTAGIIASTTQTQGQIPLVSEYNQISTVANASDTVTLPEAIAGRSCTIVNNGANVLQIFPAADDVIESLAADASTTLDPGHSVVFKSYNLINWEAISLEPVHDIDGDLDITGDLDVGGDLDVTGAVTVGAYVRKNTITPTAAASGPTAPTAVTVGTFIGLAFDADAEQVDVIWRIPSDWDGGDISFVPHWCAESGTPLVDSETVKFDITYRSIAENEALTNGTAATSTYTYTQSGGGVDLELLESPIPLLFDDANQPLSAGDYIGIQFNRDMTTDTYAADANVFIWYFEYSSTGLPQA